jgi:hypothetical protein
MGAERLQRRAEYVAAGAEQPEDMALDDVAHPERARHQVRPDDDQPRGGAFLAAGIAP